MLKLKIGKRTYSLSSLLIKYARGIFSVYIVGLLVLPFQKRKNRIITTGHTYNGNAKAFSEWLAKNTDTEVGFACDDPALYNKLKRSGITKGVRLLSLQSLKDCLYIAGASAICTTHGPSFFKSWGKRKNRPVFIGLWHGVGFKGTMRKNVGSMAFFDAFFVSSPFFKQLHEKWGFPSEKLYVAGYARTDKLINSKVADSERRKILTSYGLSHTKRKIILFAPTWKKKDNGRLDIFGEDLEVGLTKLDKIAQDNNSIIVFRPHLNSDIKLNGGSHKNLKIVSAAQYPDTENMLRVTDVLVTDWSSIFTDYLALRRPIIFLDSEPDFEMTGLDRDDRPGEKVSNYKQFELALANCFSSVTSDKKNAKEFTRVTEKAWGATLDGRSSERYYKNIKELLKSE